MIDILATEYTYEKYTEGYLGFLHLIKDMVYNDYTSNGKPYELNLACSDKSRNTFYRLDYERIWIGDGKGKSITRFMDLAIPWTKEHFSKHAGRMAIVQRDITDGWHIYSNNSENYTVEETLDMNEMNLAIVNDKTKARKILYQRLRNDLKEFVAI